MAAISFVPSDCHALADSGSNTDMKCVEIRAGGITKK